MGLFGKKADKAKKDIEEIRKEVIEKRKKDIDRADKKGKREQRLQTIDTVIDVVGEKYPAIGMSADLVDNVLDHLDLDNDVPDDTGTFYDKIQDAMEDIIHVKKDKKSVSKVEKKIEDDRDVLINYLVEQLKNEKEVPKEIRQYLEKKVPSLSQRKETTKQVQAPSRAELPLDREKRPVIDRKEIPWKDSRATLFKETRSIRSQLTSTPNASMHTTRISLTSLEHPKEIGRMMASNKPLDKIIEVLDDFLDDAGIVPSKMDPDDLARSIAPQILTEMRRNIRTSSIIGESSEIQRIIEDYLFEIKQMSQTPRASMENGKWIAQGPQVTLMSNIMKRIKDAESAFIDNAR